MSTARFAPAAPMGAASYLIRRCRFNTPGACFAPVCRMGLIGRGHR